MKILIACEIFGRVREAFRAMGHDAWSNDILDAEDRSPYHIKCDVRLILNDGWDAMIAHPPCTDLAISGAKHFKFKAEAQKESLELVSLLLNSKIPLIALENPVGVISTKIRKPDQIIQPWMFGHRESKATCLWLKGLPKLKPTNVTRSFYLDAKTPGAYVNNSIHEAVPGKDRAKYRSRTFQGIADAMAQQWGAMQ